MYKILQICFIYKLLEVCYISFVHYTVRYILLYIIASVKKILFHSTEGKGVLPSSHSEETPGAEEKERNLHLSTSILLDNILYCWWSNFCPSESSIIKYKCLEAFITHNINHPSNWFQQVLASVQSPTAGKNDHLSWMRILIPKLDLLRFLRWLFSLQEPV